MNKQISLHSAASLLGRLGGSSTSKAKTAAARVNGRKGGRPRLRLCIRCRWFTSLKCPLTAFERECRLRPSCPNDRGPVCDLYLDARSSTSNAQRRESRDARFLARSKAKRTSKKRGS